jgi:hypothetical protein
LISFEENGSLPAAQGFMMGLYEGVLNACIEEIETISRNTSCALHAFKKSLRLLYQ